jgi:2-methylcitrate dehydratase
MQLSEEELVNAFGIAGASNNPLYISRRGEASMLMCVAHAYATHNAIQACQLAKNGMTGPEAIFEGPFGFFESVSDGEIMFPDQPNFDNLRIMKTSIKSFACGYYIHSPVTGVLQLIDEHEIEPEEIDSIRIGIFEHAAGMLATSDKWATDLNRETADHSIPYTVAVAVLEGEVTPDQYSERYLRDASIHELMNQIKVEGAPELTDHRSQYPRHIPSITTITVDEKEYKKRIDCPLGHPENPMTDEQIEQKMIKNCQSYLSVAQIQQIISTCRSVTELDSLNPLLRRLVI